MKNLIILLFPFSLMAQNNFVVEKKLSEEATFFLEAKNIYLEDIETSNPSIILAKVKTGEKEVSLLANSCEIMCTYFLDRKDVNVHDYNHDNIKDVRFIYQIVGSEADEIVVSYNLLSTEFMFTKTLVFKFNNISNEFDWKTNRCDFRLSLPNLTVTDKNDELIAIEDYIERVLED